MKINPIYKILLLIKLKKFKAKNKFVCKVNKIIIMEIPLQINKKAKKIKMK